MANYGSTYAPSQNTINYDAILSTCLSNYSRTLNDNISKSNAFWYMVQQMGGYQGVDGGFNIAFPLMYALGNFDWYDGYDKLDVSPTDGVTTAFFDWRQAAAPISISRKEERQNSTETRIIDLMETKIMQSELGIKEGINRSMLQGSYASGGTSIFVNASSAKNGSLGIEPIANLINPMTAGSQGNPIIGNINYQTSTWWQNQYLQSGLLSTSNASAFLMEATHAYNNAAKGPGGPPKLILTDQTTYELWNTAYYQVYRRGADTDNDFPFENIKFKGALVVWDEFVPDVKNNTLDTVGGLGTAYFINPQYWAIKFDSESNFVATPFVRPGDQDAKVAHILWMGNTVVSNRRKQAVWYGIPRTLTFAN
jgi:hypothetical protein